MNAGMPVGLLAALVLAGAGPAAGVVVEAETAAVRTAGAATEGGWNLHSVGEVGEYVRISTEGEYTVLVRARGSPSRGVWPLMAAGVDGTAGPPVTVGAAEWADYALRVRLPAGVHRVTVGFLNDAVEGGEDRNLYVDRFEVVAPEGGAAPVRAGREEWAALGDQREEAVLAQARADADRHRRGAATVRVVGADGRLVAGAAVTAELARHDFLFGCNIYMFDRFKTAAENAAYKERFRDLFNYATVGFYWRWYEAERGRPNYAYTDQVAAWCVEQGIRMKGHPLLWGDRAGVPPWSPGQPAPEVQKARVREILGRYGDRIGFWEVVNEPSHCRGVTIDEPYRWAREADPKAALIVNDYYVMANGHPPFLKLLQDAKASGVPFDGIGIQAHEPRSMRFPLDQVRRILDRYAALGVGLHITEFTPASGGERITGSHREGTWDEAAQAEYAERFYRVCFAHPAVVAITWWDLSDQGSWLKGGGLLRSGLSPKPAYEALRRLIHGEWKTRVEGRTDEAGVLALRGIHGTYRVRAEAVGRRAERECRLGREGPNAWTVELK